MADSFRYHDPQKPKTARIPREMWEIFRPISTSSNPIKPKDIFNAIHNSPLARDHKFKPTINQVKEQVRKWNKEAGSEQMNLVEEQDDILADIDEAVEEPMELGPSDGKFYSDEGDFSNEESHLHIDRSSLNATAQNSRAPSASAYNLFGERIDEKMMDDGILHKISERPDDYRRREVFRPIRELYQTAEELPTVPSPPSPLSSIFKAPSSRSSDFKTFVNSGRKKKSRTIISTKSRDTEASHLYSIVSSENYGFERVTNMPPLGLAPPEPLSHADILAGTGGEFDEARIRRVRILDL